MMTSNISANIASLDAQRHQTQHTTSRDDGTSPTTALEFLAFTFGQEEYGVDFQKVQELRGYDTVTRIANSPDFIKGVVNLRGVIAPIIDMRIKFSFGALAYDQFTVVIILNTADRTWEWWSIAYRT